MKKIKKIVSILLTAIMVLAMCVPVMADETVTNNTKHEYKAYQIFSGDQESSDSTLSNIKWGTDVDSDNIIIALAADTTNYSELSGDNAKTGDAAAVYIAECLAKTSDNSKLANDFAKVVAANLKKGENGAIVGGTKIDANDKSVNLSAGYYLFVDQTKNDGSLNEVIGLSLLQVTRKGNIEIKAKVDKPTVEKKVWEHKFIGETYGKGYNDTADYNIGDDVSFKLIGTVVDMSQFETYKYEFCDRFAPSFTLDETSIEVSLADSKGADGTKIDKSYYKVETSTETNSFSVKFNDLKKVPNIEKGKYVIVTYKAKLNDKAAIGRGTVENTNEGNVNEVYLKYSNNPNQGGEGEMGKTLEDKVIVFTYELDGTKTEKGTETKLKDAEFVLYKSADASSYVKLENSKVTSWTSNKSEATIIKSGDDGTFKIIGLDDGIYYLEETKAPSGYNKLSAPIKIEIKANTNNGHSGNGFVNELTEIKIKIDDENEEDGTLNTGIVTMTVENSKGSTLPETGGIGTTIFYTVGVILMLGAGVLLITKKRMSSNN